MIQKQIWKDEVRILITSDRVIFEFYKRYGYKTFDGNNNFFIKKL